VLLEIVDAVEHTWEIIITEAGNVLLRRIFLRDKGPAKDHLLEKNLEMLPPEIRATPDAMDQSRHRSVQQASNCSNDVARRNGRAACLL